MLTLNARAADLTDMRELLLERQARKVDVVAPASQIKFQDAQLVLSGVDPAIDERGVTTVNGKYRPTDIFDEGLSEKLGIPLAYVRRMRRERPDLYDANANGLLRGKYKRSSPNGPLVPVYPGDDRKFMLRLFAGDDTERGIARTILSDRYAVMDDLDVLTATLDGINRAGVPVEVDGCDLTDRRMYIRIKAPAVTALAPTLLAGYRSPFSGAAGADNPEVFAGFVVSNSETGDGAFSITPRLIVRVCSNGMTMTKDAVKAVHLGGKIDQGVVRWSHDTIQKNLEVVTAKARDAVATFLDVEYMKEQIRLLEQKSGKPVEGKLDEHITQVTKKLGFDQEQQDSVFAMFIKGGQLTAGGVMQAVTAAAKDQKDADKAYDMESQALKALELSFAA